VVIAVPLYWSVGIISIDSSYIQGVAVFYSVQLSIEYLIDIPFVLCYWSYDRLLIKNEQLHLRNIIKLLILNTHWVSCKSSENSGSSSTGNMELKSNPINKPFSLRGISIREAFQQGFTLAGASGSW
jgi:hypothetical protein